MDVRIANYTRNIQQRVNEQALKIECESLCVLFFSVSKCACIGRVGCDIEANRFSSCSVLMVVYMAIAGNITRVFQT